MSRVVLAPAPSSEIVCRVRPGTYRRIWWLVVVVYAFVVLYLVAIGGFYYVIGGIPSVGFYLAAYRLLGVDQFPVVIAAHGLTAGLVARDLVRVLLFSLRAGRLSLIDPREHDGDQQQDKGEQLAATTAAPAPATRSSSYVSTCRRQWTRMLGAISVKGPNFELVLLTRETIEIFVQVLQAYDSSQYTPNAWLNWSYGGLIVTNCLSSPLVSAWYRDAADPGRERFVLLLADLALDLVWFVLPLMLFPRYAGAFFGTEVVYYEDTFNVRAIMETKLMLVTSHIDLLFKIMPSLSVYFTVRKIRSLLRRSQSPPKASSAMVIDVSAAATSENGPTTIKRGGSTGLVALRHVTYLPRHLRYRWLAEQCLRRVLIVLGCFTVLMYVLLVAFRGACEPKCHLQLHPWFVYSGCRCAVQEIDCYARRIDGHDDEIDAIFRRLEPGGLQSLILTHCPALSVPPTIRRFRDLYVLEIYNSSIVRWEQDARVSSEVYPQLGSLLLVRTGLDRLPPALVHGDLPASLLEVTIVVSNLTTLPDDLDALWPHVQTLYLDRAQLTVIPRALGRMQRLLTLSLHANQIAMIPDRLFETRAFNYLVLNDNPLMELPASLGDLSNLYELQVQGTRLQWLSTNWTVGQHPHPLLKIFTRDTSLCTDPSQEDQIIFTNGLPVHCGPKGSRYRGVPTPAYYPLDGKTLERRPTT